MNPTLAILIVIPFEIRIESRIDRCKVNALRWMATYLTFHKVPVANDKSAAVDVMGVNDCIDKLN